MESTKRFILRKLSATFVATTIFAFLFGIVDGFEFEMKYNQGNQFIQRFYFYAIYIGAIILFYGNIVSIVVEKIQMKWFPQYNWLYVFILGVFGLANGLLFQVATFGGGFALLGMLAAILYGIIDKWLFMRMTKNKSIKMFLILPIISLLLCWGYLQFTSPPEPPFTKEDAVTFATSGKGTMTEKFPEDIGTKEDYIEGYHVTRETNAKEISEEIYQVTFVEHWEKGDETGTYSFSFQVEKGSLMRDGEQGEALPYY